MTKAKGAGGSKGGSRGGEEEREERVVYAPVYVVAQVHCGCGRPVVRPSEVTTRSYTVTCGCGLVIRAQFWREQVLGGVEEPAPAEAEETEEEAG